MQSAMPEYLSDVIKGLCKRQLGFNHTELWQVVTRVGIFSAERRTKRVDFRQRTATKKHSTSWPVYNNSTVSVLHT